ncbi:hypothetical protein [Paenibacillus sp. CF384]|uniref:hypothetical protein n=1 Tax=Paenibacillus sp. CF384 TaxID=1884382 RepID=UPI00089D9589|nr:hypothetical protein [Paenibacillus sp. CF384]SDW79703.1 hypothetical protein SAMN05518855_1005145 [Paenibacillus sp. CF384]
MSRILFNRTPLRYGGAIEQPTIDVLKNTPQLWNASLDDALKYGGELTKAAIGAMDLRFDRKHIVVDTKVHMLMPGMCPAIPNWHTDGVPRGKELRPEVKDVPNIHAQEEMTTSRFHLIVTGAGCLTEFVAQPQLIELPDGPHPDLNKLINQATERMRHCEENIPLKTVTAPSCQAVEFDWWTIHRGVYATKHEWRYLIRVAETDHMEPQTDLRQILRTQVQVYVPESFAW